MTSIPYSAYRPRVLGCWLGKAVGGTLGGPWEGVPMDHELTFYEPVPTEMMANDDLDLQVVWLQTVRQRGLPIDRRLLADAWLDHVRLWPGEYGVCRQNLERGLFPPTTGLYDNGLADGMGAAIRTELWACLAPGAPDLAVHLAKEDACADHAGAGVDAAVFLAAVESAAFVEADRDRLLDLGLGYLPADSEIGAAVRLVRRAWAETPDRAVVLDRLLDAHFSQDFTYTPMNLGIIVLGWLAGGGRFGPSITAAVNCGQDTDCTAATVGALIGLLDPDGIEDRWLAPIGRDLVLSPGMVGMAPARDLDGFTDQVADLAVQVLDYYGADVEIAGAPATSHAVPVRTAAAHALGRGLDGRDSLVAAGPYEVTVRYPEGVSVAPGQTAGVEVVVRNLTGETVEAPVRLLPPAGWSVSPVEHRPAPLAPGAAATLRADVAPEEPRWRPSTSPLVVEVGEGAGRHAVEAGLLMTVPYAVWDLDGEPGAAPPERPEGAALVEAPGHFVDLGAVAVDAPWRAFQTHVKLPYDATPRVVVQCFGRPTVTWIDGDRVGEQPGRYVNPATHLAYGTGADVELGRGTYTLTVAVGPRQDPASLLDGGPLAHETRSLLTATRADVIAEREGDRLFVSFGHGDLWRWVQDLEVQNPLAWPGGEGK